GNRLVRGRGASEVRVGQRLVRSWLPNQTGCPLRQPGESLLRSSGWPTNYRPTSQDSPSLGSDRGHNGGKGENGTAAFPGKSRNRDGFARSAGISGSFF